MRTIKLSKRVRFQMPKKKRDDGDSQAGPVIPIRITDPSTAELIKKFKDENGNFNALANEILREELPKLVEKYRREMRKKLGG